MWSFSLHRFCAFRQVEMNVRVALENFTHGFHGDGHEVEETLQVQI